MLGHPNLLLRSSQPYPDHIRATIVDTVDDVFVFSCRDWVKWRRPYAGRLEPLIPRLQTFDQTFRDPRSSAKEKMPASVAKEAVREGQHQVWSIDASYVRKATPFHEQHQWHTVGCPQASLTINPAQEFIALAAHHRMHVAQANIMPSPLYDP